MLSLFGILDSHHLLRAMRAIITTRQPAHVEQEGAPQQPQIQEHCHERVPSTQRYSPADLLRIQDIIFDDIEVKMAHEQLQNNLATGIYAWVFSWINWHDQHANIRTTITDVLETVKGHRWTMCLSKCCCTSLTTTKTWPQAAPSKRRSTESWRPS